MGFEIKPSKLGAGTPKSQLSVAAAPYQVNLKNGKRRFCGELREIYRLIPIKDVVSVFDRHKKRYLDLETLWKHRRRKFIDGPTN